MIKATFAGPVRHAANQIDFTPADFPSFVSKFDDRAHWTSADDAPFPIRDVGNSYRFTVDQSRDGPDSDCVSDAINVAAQWRVPMINVFRSAKHFQIQTRAALAPDIDRVALVKIDSPGRSFGLPGQPVKLHREFCRGPLWIITTQALHRRRLAVSNRDNPCLLWFQIDLKSEFVILVIAIQ